MTKSKFEEIYRDLKYHVEQGDYLYSELLPSENNLIGIYDCSRNSICRAIAGLVKDGYVQAVHGKGVQVIFQPSEKTNFTVGGIESFQETAARNVFCVNISPNYSRCTNCSSINTQINDRACCVFFRTNRSAC